MVRECRLEPFERQIRRAHDRLAHVVKAMDHMPVVVFGQLDAALQPGVDFDNGVQTVQLVRHRGCEDGLVLVPHDGCR